MSSCPRGTRSCSPTGRRVGARSALPTPDYPDIPSCAISRKESDLLAELTAGKAVLEIGSWLGYSTVWMALNGAQVVAVDPHEWNDTKLPYERNLRRFGVAVETIYCKSQDWVLPGYWPQFDAAFIDGDHSYEVARHDLLLARRVVKPGGWIIAHDYAYPGYNFAGCPDVVRAVDETLGDLREVRRAGWMYAARTVGRVLDAPDGAEHAKPVDG